MNSLNLPRDRERSWGRRRHQLHPNRWHVPLWSYLFDHIFVCRQPSCFVLLVPISTVNVLNFCLRKKGSKTKRRMREEEIEKGDCGAPNPKSLLFFFEILSDLNQAIPNHLADEGQTRPGLSSARWIDAVWFKLILKAGIIDKRVYLCLVSSRIVTSVPPTTCHFSVTACRYDSAQCTRCWAKRKTYDSWQKHPYASTVLKV